MNMIENEEKITRALLVSVDTGDFDAEASLAELEELVKSAGAVPEFTLTQKLQRPESATFVGSGKLLEIKELCEAQELDLIVVDSELTPTQIKNIENFTDVRVIDRTTLILDIFAQRARSKEGKLQVELAQLKYLLPRLTGKGIEMSRLGGGIGTRGPGETKIETDRRHIRRRMETLKDELAEVEKHRHMLRRRREKDGVITCAIVGYTNAGKSTLMNTLTDAGVLAQDKLFATLDPTTRTAVLPDGQKVLFTDTVGFINKLPHNLVDAFRSTLEEAGYADIIIHVIDASDPQAEMHRKVVYDTLRELDISGRPVITVWNKSDLAEEDALFRDFDADASVKISAKTGAGLDDFYCEVAGILRESRVCIDTVISYKDTAIIAEIRRAGQLICEEYEADGIHIKAYAPRALVNRISKNLPGKIL